MQSNVSERVNVVCVVGGSGSTYLASSLGKKFCVCRKPDAVLRTNFELGRFDDAREFNKAHLAQRGAGFSCAHHSHPMQFATELLEFLATNSSHIAVLNTLHEYGILTSLRCRNVAFLFRDPLDAYISYSKAYRHGRVISELGGLSSHAGMLFFARKWNALADEYLHAQELKLSPVKLMHEYLDRDLVKFGLVDRLDDFRPTQDRAALSIDFSREFYDLIGNRFLRIFEREARNWQSEAK